MNPYHESWTEYAVCREVAPDLWFPEKGETLAKEGPRRMCMERCSVRLQCLDYAMRLEVGNDRSHRYGIWGGLTPKKRADLEPQWLAEQAAEVAA
jgi:WhiB family redox-sensing transcriptional regulator